MSPPAAKRAKPKPKPPQVGDLLRLDLQLCFALYSSGNLMSRLYRPLLEPLGLTYPQYLAMMALWEASPQTVGGLGLQGRSRLGQSDQHTPLILRVPLTNHQARALQPFEQRGQGAGVQAELAAQSSHRLRRGFP